MTTKIVYFTVDGRLQKAEFSTDDHADDVKGKYTVYTCISCVLLFYRKKLLGSTQSALLSFLTVSAVLFSTSNSV